MGDGWFHSGDAAVVHRDGYSRMVFAYNEDDSVAETIYFDASDREVKPDITVRVVGRNSAGQQAGVAVGDVLISYDGQKVVSAQQYQGLTASAGGGERTLLVRRNGQLVPLTVPPGGLGLSVVPVLPSGADVGETTTASITPPAAALPAPRPVSNPPGVTPPAAARPTTTPLIGPWIP